MPPAPPPPPAVSEPVDLARTGLTGATDVQAVLAAIRPDMSVLAPPTGPSRRSTVVRTRDPTNRTASRGRVIALLVVLGVVALVGTVLAVVLSRQTRDGGAGGEVGRTVSVEAPEPGLGTVALTGQPVAPPDGADAMRAVATLRSGDVVAVGVSAATQPRAWLSRGGEATFVQPEGEENGQMSDVAALPSGAAVAVGFTGSGAARRPGVWMSADGSRWRLVPPRGDFAPGTGVTELFAVTTTAEGTLLAVGKDVRTDRTDGDGAVFASADGGNSWTRVQASGLDGPGPQTVQRLIRGSDGQYVAIGSVLSGARQGPAIWTSPDGLAWQSSPYLPDGAPTLTGVAQVPGGRLITCGSVGSSDRPAVRCWVRNEQQRWDRWDVTATGPAPLFLYGIAVQADTVVMVGVGQSGGTADAATWTAQLLPA